jgi:hypothetical protein
MCTGHADQPDDQLEMIGSSFNLIVWVESKPNQVKLKWFDSGECSI